MQKYFFVLLLIAICIEANADMPYMPFSFELKTKKESYFEGERVEFILTITNADKKNTYPLLTPGSQNSGLKLIHLDVYDRAKNISILRAKEDRNINMMIKHIGIIGIVMLKPGEKISIPFYWNDFMDGGFSYQTKTASHHLLDLPLFVGEYRVAANYTPKGIGNSDSLYHFLNDTDEEQVAGKINFLGSGASANCILKIKKAPLGNINIQGINYTCMQTQKDDYFFYFTDEKAKKEFNPTHAVSTTIGSYEVINYDYSYYPNVFAEFVIRFPNGDIKQYRKFRNNCPTEIFERTFNDAGILIFEADRLLDGSVKKTVYHSDKRIDKEEIYAADANTKTIKQYIYNKDKSLRRIKVTVIQDPCIMQLL